MARSPIESLLHWGLIPVWRVPGLVDWWFHRRSGIERPDHGGTEEPLIHSLMLAESGLPVLLALFGEVNPGAAAVLTAALAHEAAAHRDLALASGSAREVTAGEQQTHSFVETLPFMLVGVLAASNWPRLPRPGGSRPRGGCGGAMSHCRPGTYWPWPPS